MAGHGHFAMKQPPAIPTLDRHALVMAIWLPSGLIAVSLLHDGIGRSSVPCILGGFGVVIAGFVGHVLVNAVYGTDFSVRERAVGLVLYGAALLTCCFAAIARPEFAARAFIPVCGGLILLFAVVLFTMLTSYGTRGAFQAFDVIRSFRAPPAASAEEAESRE